MAHKVGYSYFVGRLALYDENFVEAEKNLSYAFKRTPKSAAKNKRRIAQFLVCTRLNLGVIPTQYMLTKYNLSQFSDIVYAIKTVSTDAYLTTQPLPDRNRKVNSHASSQLREKLHPCISASLHPSLLRSFVCRAYCRCFSYHIDLHLALPMFHFAFIQAFSSGIRLAFAPENPFFGQPDSVNVALHRLVYNLPAALPLSLCLSVPISFSTDVDLLFSLFLAFQRVIFGASSWE